MSVLRGLLLKGSQSAWLRRQATRRRFVRRAVSRFMPGESVEDALAAARRLGERGFGTILTHLGENLRDRSEAVATLDHYRRLAEGIAAAKLDAEISVKLTQLGLDLDPDMTIEHVRRLATETRVPGRRLWIDMESSEYVERTVSIFEALRKSGAEIGLCLQAYLRRTPSDLERLLPLAPALRIVKGAYREPDTVALQNRAEIDRRFFELTARLLQPEARRAGVWLTVGTHDPALLRRIEGLARERGLGRDDLEYALLYGIQVGEQGRLAAAGHRVRVLISYGSHWFPWYMRRLAEKPSNVMLVARSLFAASR